MRLYKCNFPSGVAGTWYTCNVRTVCGFSQSMAAYTVIVRRDVSLTRYKHIQWLIIYLCVHLARRTCIHCIALQRTWNQAVFCTWVLCFVTWWLGGAGAQAIVTWLRIGTGWTTCTGQSRTTNGYRPTHVKTTLCKAKDCIFVCDIGVLSVGTAHITSSALFLTLHLLSYPIQLPCTYLDRTSWSNRESYGFWRLLEGSLFESRFFVVLVFVTNAETVT